jgi:glycosyltransferase involved in cell wall biosynthesis
MVIGVDARCLEWQRGYVAGFTEKIIQALTKKENFQIVLFFQNYVPDDIKKIENDIKICLLKGPKILLSKRILSEQIILPYFVWKEKCNYLIAPTYSAPLLIKCKLILCIWDITYSTNKKDYSFLMGLSLRIFSYISSKLANKIITCSNFDANQIIAHYNIIKEKIVVINFPPRNKYRFAQKEDLIEIENLKIKLRLPHRYILCLGVIYNRRNIDKIISGYKQSKLYINKTVGLAIVGRDATNPSIKPKKLMEELVKEKIGYYSDWAEEDDFMHLMQGAEFYVCTSKIDGEGIILKEAAMCGIPVITSPMLKDSVSGNCIIINDPSITQEWTDVFNKVSLQSINKDILIKKSYNYVKTLSWEEVEEKTINCLV